MALWPKDYATATSIVTETTEDSLGAIWLRDDKRTPNYQSLGLLHGYKLGDYGSLNPYPMPTCGAMTNVRQATCFLG